MKKLVICLSILVLSFGANAQDDELLKWNVSLGVGAPNLSRYSNFIAKTIKEKANYDVSGKGPFHFKVEYRPIWWLGVGMNVNHMSYKATYTVDYTNTNGDNVPNHITVSNSNTAFNIRGNLHLLNPEHYGSQGDIYWGMGLGYKAGKFKVSGEYADGTPKITLPNLIRLGFETTVGVKYYITPHIGAYAELGFAKSIIQLGATAAF